MRLFQINPTFISKKKLTVQLLSIIIQKHEHTKCASELEPGAVEEDGLVAYGKEMAADCTMDTMDNPGFWH